MEHKTYNDEIGFMDYVKANDLLSHSSLNPNDYYFVKTDNAFTKKARLLQAIRRYQSGADRGSFEKDSVIYYHPNLANDGEITGCNFLNHEIFEYAKYRIAYKKPYETIRKDRLFNNFLSSQPMAFNLFFPLIKIVESKNGQKKLAKIVTKLVDSNKNLNIDRIVEVGIEFIPYYYEFCLNDKTAMDAYFRYFTTDGKKGIIAIETKYTDELGENQAKKPALGIKTATERDGVAQLFTTKAKEKILSGETKLSQVFRNFLLTETVRLYENLDDSLSIVIAPKDNTSNTEDENHLREALDEGYKYKFQVIELETFVNALMKGFPKEHIFQKFWHRYLGFEIVESVKTKLGL
jgi:hypothetical protein